MGYVNAEFYKKVYHCNSIPDNVLQARLDKACMDVDRITRMKIKKYGGFDKLSDHEKNCVQWAVCSQADHSYIKASMKGVSSYSVGDVSVSFDASEEYAKECLEYLSMTRLVYRGL